MPLIGTFTFYLRRRAQVKTRTVSIQLLNGQQVPIIWFRFLVPWLASLFCLDGSETSSCLNAFKTVVASSMSSFSSWWLRMFAKKTAWHPTAQGHSVWFPVQLTHSHSLAYKQSDKDRALSNVEAAAIKIRKAFYHFVDFTLKSRSFFKENRWFSFDKE